MGQSRWTHTVAALIDEARRQHVFQAAALLVGHEGRAIHQSVFGLILPESLFDVASLTKPLATTSLAMRFCDEGRLSLSDTVARWVPAFKAYAIGRTPLIQLFTHSSGLGAWRPFYRVLERLPSAQRKSRLRLLLANSEFEYVPGTRSVYSDLGFMVLGEVLERVGGAKLDALFRDQIAKRIGLPRTLFLQPRRASKQVSGWSIVPTAYHRRHGRLCGLVHDDNCRALGGVAGHAGLFTTVDDVHGLVRELVSAFHGGGSLFSTAVVRAFWQEPRQPNSTRVIGWDTPTPGASSAGRYFGPGSVGHLGFTGTSLWIDPERARWVIFLANSVYYRRDPTLMRSFRPALHDAIMAGLR